MTDVKLPSIRKEEARASLRNHVIPHLNAKGHERLDEFLANPTLKPGQTFEDVAFDITDSKHVTRSFKEGEVIAITALLEAFAVNEAQYLSVQAPSPKAHSVQDHIDRLDSALFAGGADYTKLGQLIGGLRTLVASPDQTDVIQWFFDNARKQGIKLAPNDVTALQVQESLNAIKQTLEAPSLAEKFGERKPAERVRA